MSALHEATDRLNDVIDRLLGPNGCPWDKEQTPDSLTEYLVEEGHELVDAIREGSETHVREELGDVAFLLFFVARLYEAKGGPSLNDALTDTAAKMIRRHPHVFGEAEFATLDEQLRNWEHIKREEKKNTKQKGLFAGLPAGLPPLTKAYRLHSKAARVDFTWPTDEEVEQQVEAEWLEVLDACAADDKEAIAHELGDHMFTLVELARRKGFKASEILDAANRRFLSRFERMEMLAEAKNVRLDELSLDDKDELWEAVKAEEKAAKEDKTV